MVNEALFTLMALLDVALVLAVCLLGYRLYRKDKKHHQELTMLHDDMSAICVSTSGFGGHLNRVENQLRRIYERQDQLDLREPDNRAYSKAIKLVQSGADVETLMSSCGLVRAESELLMLLHGGSDANRKNDRKSYASASGRTVSDRFQGVAI